MDGIEIRDSRKTIEDGCKTHVAELAFLIAGIFGVLSFLQSMAGVPFSDWPAYLTAFASCWIIWYIYYGRRKVFPLLVLVLTTGCVIAMFVLWDAVRQQLKHIINFFTGRGWEPMAITETAVILAVLLSVFMAVMEFCIRSHVLLYFLTLFILLSSPVMGIRIGIGSMFLLLLYQAAFWVIHYTAFSGRKDSIAYQASIFGIIQEELLSGMKRAELGSEKKGGLAVKSSLIAGVMLFLVFAAMVPVYIICREMIYDTAYSIEGEVRRAVSVSTGASGRLVEGGSISAQNNYPTGTKHLSVSASSKPRRTVYLSGFKGGIYIGGDWIPADDEELFLNIMEHTGWEESLDIVKIRYDIMYYSMNYNMKSGKNAQSYTLTLKHYGSGKDQIYIPYYSQRSRIYEYDERNDYWKDKEYGDIKNGYTFRCYEQQDLDIDWDDVITNYYIMRDWYKQMQTAYMEEIQTAYTMVPTEILPRLSELCKENSMGNLDEITAFIVYTLHSNASYTLMPGWAPKNKDIVEYFLFESGRGYCQHFAAAATLMYRMYGVPARYVTGYMLSPDAFELSEDGTWEAIATDENAHAWVEIFLEDYGWTPVEVTPSSEGNSAASYPGFDSELLGRIMQNHGWEEKTVGLEADNQDNRGESWLGEGFSFDWNIDFEKHWKLFFILGTGFVYSVCLLPFFLDYRRLRRLRRLNGEGCRRIFFRLLQMLRFAGYMPEYDGTEDDFAVRLAEKLPAVALKEIAGMQKIVSETAYGNTGSAPEKEEYVIKVYLHLAAAVYEKLKWHKKLIFRYWKAFI